MRRNTVSRCDPPGTAGLSACARHFPFAAQGSKDPEGRGFPHVLGWGACALYSSPLSRSPYGRRSRSEPGGARAVLGTRGRSRWAAATGFLSGAAAAAAGVAPAEPLLRPPPQRGPGAAMPSDFISLLSADLDLESPKSLYSKGESAAEAAQGLLRSPRRPARIAGGRAVGASQQAVARCLRAPPASREQPGPGGCGCAEASLGGAGGRPKAEAPFPESPEGRRRRPERRPGGEAGSG